MKFLSRNLSIRLFLLLTGILLVIFSIHTYTDIRHTSTLLNDDVYYFADRACEMIKRSTRYSMLLNRKEDVHETIRAIGAQPGFVGINIYNKGGETIFSTDSTSVGRTVDMKAEACVICHAEDEPLSSVPDKSTMRVYQSEEQGHVLGLIHPIRNEPACYEAECHAHDPEATVLGVLDVKMSLASVDERLASMRTTMIFSSLGATLLISTLLGLFIYRVVRRPIGELIRGMNTISSGDLSTRLAIHSTTEIGELAQSFNKMADDLQKARKELREWARTLEDRVASKTKELKDMQNQIVQMEKMASLGKLSASVAHEINNPLFGILTYAKLILRELEHSNIDDKATPMIRDHLTIIQKESSRCGDIVKNLLDFARYSGGQFASHHLHAILDQTLTLLSHHFEMQQIAIEKKYMKENDEIICDANQCQQAFIAMCMNAVESMHDGGTLTVQTNFEDENIIVKITDTGIGIPEDVLPRIFEPFFTTKKGKEGETAAGLGLGLSVVYGIVQRHHGIILVDSTLGKGTTFTIRMPRNPAKEQSEENHSTREEPSTSANTRELDR
ncbi:MAG: HAMP domain-containing protein [Candidatus Latescibacteria bacterium]|nr:HAMP domain-containing protein [Candidatus Latescibacterota bacterium]NIO56804.1 HAMP domain-containing protein [Candidatus Latescibacterota bacterium]